MRFRAGPVRFGGGRRASLTMGFGPLGVTVGGSRKGRSSSRSSTNSGGSTATYEPTQEEIQYRHAQKIHRELIVQAAKTAKKVINEYEENSLDGTYLSVFVKRCLVMLVFAALVLFTTRDVEHVFLLYLVYSGALLIGLSPAASLYQQTTNDDSWLLFDGVDTALQIGRTNFAAGYLPMWLLVAGALVIENIFDLSDIGDVVSLMEILKFFIIYLVVVSAGAWIKSFARTKSKVVATNELGLLFWNHLFLSMPKKSMLYYEVLKLNLKFLLVLQQLALKQAESDAIYGSYFGRGNGRYEDGIVVYTQLIEKFETNKKASQKGRDLLLLSTTCYFEPKYAAKLAVEHEKFRPR
jgi:hypothetical protein